MLRRFPAANRNSAATIMMRNECRSISNSRARQESMARWLRLLPSSSHEAKNDWSMKNTKVFKRCQAVLVFFHVFRDFRGQKRFPGQLNQWAAIKLLQHNESIFPIMAASTTVR